MTPREQEKCMFRSLHSPSGSMSFRHPDPFLDLKPWVVERGIREFGWWVCAECQVKFEKERDK